MYTKIYYIFFTIIIVCKAWPSNACKGTFTEENVVSEDQVLELAIQADQLRQSVQGVKDEIKYIKKHFSNTLKSKGEKYTVILSPENLEEIHKFRAFLYSAYKRLGEMDAALLDDAQSMQSSKLQKLKDRFEKLETNFQKRAEAFNKKTSYLEEQLRKFLYNGGNTISNNGLQSKTEASLSNQQLLSDLIESPHLIQAKTSYFVEFLNGQGSTSVVFYKGIVRLFSDSKNTTFSLGLLRRNLYSIKKGFMSKTGSSGLKILSRTRTGSKTRYKDIFEVKIMGKTAGFFRLGGFKDSQGRLYIVHYTKASDHTAARMHNFIETIALMKKNFEEGVLELL